MSDSNKKTEDFKTTMFDRKEENEESKMTNVEISQKCEEIELFLNNVAEGSLNKVSKKNKIQLLQIQAKLAMMNIDDDQENPVNEQSDDKLRTDNECQRRRDKIKKEREYYEKKGALPRKEKYLNYLADDNDSDNDDTFKRKIKKFKEVAKQREETSGVEDNGKVQKKLDKLGKQQHNKCASCS